MADDVELSIQGEVALVRLCRPAKGNALRGAIFDTLRKLALKLADSPPRYVVLTGEGPDFCVGLDRDPADPMYVMFEQMVRQRDAHRAQETVTRIRGSFDVFARLPCPVIAAIEGRCHGAGLEFAMVADFRVVARGASLRFVEGHHGLVSGLGGLVRASTLIGPVRSMDLVLSGTPIDGEEARRIGLASRVAPDGGTLSSALELVQELRRTPTIARTQALLALRSIHHRLAADLFEQESQAAARTWIANDWQQALQAVGQGKDPSG